MVCHAALQSGALVDLETSEGKELFFKEMPNYITRAFACLRTESETKGMEWREDTTYSIAKVIKCLTVEELETRISVEEKKMIHSEFVSLLNSKYGFKSPQWTNTKQKANFSDICGVYIKGLLIWFCRDRTMVKYLLDSKNGGLTLLARELLKKNDGEISKDCYMQFYQLVSHCGCYLFNNNLCMKSLFTNDVYRAVIRHIIHLKGSPYKLSDILFGDLKCFQTHGHRLNGEIEQFLDRYRSAATADMVLDKLCQSIAVLECCISLLFSHVNMQGNLCRGCGKLSLEPLMKCSLCREAGYCSRACQKRDWKRHKPRCKERENRLEEGGQTQHATKSNMNCTSTMTSNFLSMRTQFILTKLGRYCMSKKLHVRDVVAFINFDDVLFPEKMIQFLPLKDAINVDLKKVPLWFQLDESQSALKEMAGSSAGLVDGVLLCVVHGPGCSGTYCYRNRIKLPGSGIDLFADDYVFGVTSGKIKLPYGSTPAAGGGKT